MVRRGSVKLPPICRILKKCKYHRYSSPNPKIQASNPKQILIFKFQNYLIL
jgi:hypothetical protein